MSRIVTFYSYKGGVGRTFALANIGVLLAKRGKRVLLMDWDLEAPGLHRYFSGQDWAPERGVIQLLHEAAANPAADWRGHLHEVEVSDVNAPGVAHRLSVMTSGVAAEDYTNRVRGFSWPDFFERRGGGPLLERWREEWKQAFDFVLIDSRTGITDAGGVCTILLPDFMVLVFTANEQSLEGALAIASSAQAQRRGLAVARPPLMFLPLLSRFDRRDEISLSDQWLERVAKDFKPLYGDWLPSRIEPRRILELTKVPYITRFSFGEPLPVVTHRLTDPELPGFYLDNCARLLLSDFRDAERIVDPEAKPPLDAAGRVRELIERAPIDEAELYKRLRVAEEELGEGAELGRLLNDVGLALGEQARPNSAEPYFRRAISINERHFGPNNPEVAAALNNLGLLLKDTSRFTEAEPLMRRALAINEAAFGSEHPKVSVSLNNLAQLLKATKRLDEAETLMRRALIIRERRYGPYSQEIAVLLNNIAELLIDTHRLDESEEFIKRALDIAEQAYGPSHPNVARILNNLSLLFQNTGRLAEAEPLMLRALAIDEMSFGPEHSEFARDLNNFATLLRATNRLAEAGPFLKRSLAILLKLVNSTGHIHPSLRVVLDNYRFFMEEVKLDKAAINICLTQLGKEAGFDEESFRRLMNQVAETPEADTATKPEFTVM